MSKHHKGRTALERRRSLKEVLLKEDGSFCGWCGTKAKPRKLTLDHVKPLHMGGKDELYNLVLSCRDCNSNKGGMSPREWLNKIEKESEINK